MGALEKHFSNGKVTVILCRTWSEVQEAKMIRSIASCLKNWFEPTTIDFAPYQPQPISERKLDQYSRHRQRQKGNSHHSAVRALAFKWIRILCACWKANKPYVESPYLQVLQRGTFSVSAT